MGTYRQLLALPHVARMLTATIVGRLPIGINALAVLLFIEAQTGSFAEAGVVSGGLAAGVGVGAPLAGRLVDRFGARRVLAPYAAGHCVALGLVVVLGLADAPLPALLASSILIGLAHPPTSAVLRSMWPVLTESRPDLLSPAYAFDTVLIELVFIGGPLLTAVMVALTSPQAALAFSAAAVLLGTIAFATAPPVARRGGRAHDDDGPGRLGALRSPGIRTLVLTTLPLGICVGSAQVALPAFADAEHSAELAGVLLAVMSLASAAGGFVYGLSARSVHLTHLQAATFLPLTYGPLALASSPVVVALLVIPAGFCVAPLIATRNELAGVAAPEGALTEAYTWPVTAFVGGIAIGTGGAGAIVEAADWRAAFLAGAAAGTVGTVVALARRGTLRGAVRAPA